MSPAPTNPDAELYRWFYLAAGFLAAFNLFEIAFLLLHKRRLERQEERKLRLKHEISETLITEEDPASRLKPPAEPLEYAAYSEAAASVFDSREGEIAERARALLEKFGVDAYYRAVARGAAWYKRAGAMDVLAGFKLPANRDFFVNAFKSEDSAAVKYRAVFGLSFLARDRRDLEQLARLLSGLPYLTAKYTEDIFFNAIGALKALGREEEFNAFLEGVLKDEGVDRLVKRDCLTACHAASCEKASDTIAGYYEAFETDHEIAIASLKALSKAGRFELFTRALRHRDWRVRLTAAKQGDMLGAGALPRLRELLHDPNYHVRLSAAQALSRFGDAGLAVLRAESRGGDKYAAAAAAYALETAGEDR